MFDWVFLGYVGREFCSLKIRVSVVRYTSARQPILSLETLNAVDSTWSSRSTGAGRNVL